MKKQQEQLTLDDNSDLDDEEEYQPTEQEIIDYAKFLGMVLPEDHDLLYIAEEGVRLIDVYLLVASAGARALEGVQ